jgi:hypothetical protein
MERQLAFIPCITGYLTKSLVYSRRGIKKVIGNERSTVHDGARTTARLVDITIGVGGRSERPREAIVGVQFY